jgi:hypothetical protein
MSPSDAVVLLALALGAVLLVGLNVALQRRARPDLGDDAIAGCCGMALPASITDPVEVPGGAGESAR